MANSTLSPGRPSAAIVKLREAAMKEMEAPQMGLTQFHEPTFDHEHGPGNLETSNEFPQYHGANNPHVGNGSGPIG